MIEVNNKIRIEFIVVAITIILRRLLTDRVDCFWQPAEFENVANLDFEHFKHLQSSGHLPLIEASIPSACALVFC